MNTAYLEKLTAGLRSINCEALLFAPSEELRFYTGFSPMMCERFQGLFLKSDGSMFYYCNLLYKEEILKAYGEEIPVYTWFDGEGFLPNLEKVLKKQNLLGKQVLVNRQVPGWQILRIMEAMDIRFMDASAFLESIRLRKTEEELDYLRKAASIADRAYEDVLEFLRPGLCERQVADFLKESMSSHGGCEGGALVASGPNAGFPHYFGDSRILKPGDMVLMDYGCVYKGLHSDMTRTVFLDWCSDRWQEIYNIVDRAQTAGQETAMKGVSIPEVDKAARSIIEEAGYGEEFPYRLGHGIGYSVHEAPDIHGNNRISLDNGMVFSIEPGIYLPDGGVRIENIVAINHRGETEVLNKAERGLIII